MATRKRKSSKRRASAKRRNPVNPVNPTRRRSTKRRGGRRSVFARHRNPVNPTRRRRSGRRRHRNPTAGLLGKAFTLAASGAAIGLTQPFVGNFIRPYLGGFGASPIAGAGITFGTSWLLSLGAGMFAFTRKWKDDILLAGGTIAAAQLISAYVLPALRLGGGNGNATLGRRQYNNGLRGLGVVTGIPPTIAPLPLPTPQNNSGLQGLGVRPGVYGR